MADAMEKEKEEQARKAHTHAEKCFLAGNVSAARQWMKSAVSLAPDLPGTPQIVAAYDVHAAAGRSRSTRNWYAGLGLKPGGAHTHDDIKKQYRRLCLLVHPDKNPSAAADGAFKLIHAAWDALSAKHPPLGTAGPAPPANQRTPPPPQRQAAPPRPPEPQPRPPKPKRQPKPPEPKQKQPPEPKQRPPKQKPPEPKQKTPEPKERPPKQKPSEPKQKTPEPKVKPSEPKQKTPEPKEKPPKPKWQPKPPKPKRQPKRQPQPPKPKTQPNPPEPKERPPEPKQKPESKLEPRQRPAPTSAAPEPPTSNSQQENPKQDGKCSNCGARSFNRRTYRCMSCQWSPMDDGRRHHQPHDYDDDRHDPYENDYDDEFRRFLELLDADAQGSCWTELG